MTSAAPDFIPLDGNAVAGELSDLFARDVTTATIHCGGCGSSAEIGSVRVYGGAMGSIFRCRTCDTAVVRMVRTPRGFAIDMRGASRLFVPA
ncbi:MAG: DUF6510 family protein [Bauldia sp.]|jgi:hypothetical protein